MGRADGSDEPLRQVLSSAGHGRAFVEDRVQASVSAAPGEPVEARLLRVTGAALDGERTLHLSDPFLEDLGGPVRPRLPLSRVLSEPDLGYRRWLEIARGLSEAGWQARIVGFHQKIWVAIDGEVAHDDRRACRIEIRSGERPEVLLDVALRDGEGVAPEVLGALENTASRRSRAVRPEGDAGWCVFAPGVAGLVAHELVGHALEGDVALAGSRLSDYEQSLGPADLRVIDDPRRGRAPWTVDDEGTVPRPVTLFEGGRVGGWLLDRETAERKGVASTGHGRRGSYLDPVLPRMGCTYIDRGTTAAASIVPDTPRGILVRRMAGAHADPRRGRATFVVTDADRIEGGEVTDPLAPFVIEMDAIDALSSIDRIGDDLAFDSCIGSCVRSGQPLATSVGAPTVRLRVIRVIP